MAKARKKQPRNYREDTKKQKYIPESCRAPTDAQPGSPEKLRILMARVEAGEELWHQDDVVED